MTNEMYLQVRNYINGLDWQKYSFNLKSIYMSAKSKFNLTDEDMLDFEGFSNCEALNKIEEGFYKDYECPKCNNRSYNHFHEVKNGKIYYYVMDCECKKIRNEYAKLEACGIHKNLLDKYTLDNYYPAYPWQANCKEKALKYLEEFNTTKDFKKWFVVSGQSGAGKSHLCTSIYKEMLKAGKKVKYMPWKDSIDRLVQYRKSNFSESQKKYDKEMAELKTVDVLYIDDLFKLLPNDYDKEKTLILDLAYMIINSRYANGLITLISTEELIDDLMEIDNAICGRIFERAGKNESKGGVPMYWLQIGKGQDRDYRMQ